MDKRKGSDRDMILDATCGLKQMWFQKAAKDVVYLDMRKGNIEYSEKYLKVRPDLRNHIITPTIQADNKFLPFKDGIFDMVVYDPPQVISASESGIVQQKYTTLHPITWTMDIGKALKELFRVLKCDGFFIFKWAENFQSIKEIINLFPIQPLFGTNVSYKNKTWWIVFRKDK